MNDQFRPAPQHHTDQSSQFPRPAAVPPAGLNRPEAQQPPAAPTEQDDAAETHRGRSSKGLPKLAVRRVAAKSIELLEADEKTLNVVAGILGCKNDPVDLTVAIMTAERGAASPVKDIQATVEEAAKDQISAVLGLNAVNKAQFKAMWTTMAAVCGTDENMPSNDKKAISTLFAQINGMSAEQSQLLEDAAALLRRA